jgi:hypothetical protein
MAAHGGSEQALSRSRRFFDDPNLSVPLHDSIITIFRRNLV